MTLKEGFFEDFALNLNLHFLLFLANTYLTGNRRIPLLGVRLNRRWAYSTLSSGELVFLLRRRHFSMFYPRPCSFRDGKIFRIVSPYVNTKLPPGSSVIPLATFSNCEPY